jgi:hypothetical protein
MLNKVTLLDAKSALEENVRDHINSRTMPILRNQNIALIGICNCLERMERDLEYLHAKLQPVLKEILDDQQDWQQMTRRGG